MTRLGVTIKAKHASVDREIHHSYGLPFPGDLAVVRHRQYLVEAVQPGGPGEQTAVKLVCLDDDAAAERQDPLPAV